jgi:hypothetical protein
MYPILVEAMNHITPIARAWWGVLPALEQGLRAPGAGARLAEL